MIRMNVRNGLAAALLVAWLAVVAEAGSRWPQFRGPAGLGINEDANPPVEFGGGRNVLWKAAIPAGHSCPCVWDDRIFLTGFAAGKLQTLCVDARSGKTLWQQAAPVERMERINGTNSRSTPTPVTDGKRVYVLFGSYGLLAYDMDGKEIWRKPLDLQNVRHGSAASPILAAGRIIVNGDQEDRKSFLIAVNAENGETAWRIDRPNTFSSHTTPLHLNRNGVDEIIVAGSVRLVAYDLKDGSERWSSRGLEAISICPSPTAGEGMVYAMSYSMGEKLPTFDALLQKADRNGDGLVAHNEAPKLVQDVLSIIDSNHDNRLSREEWDESMKVFKLADNGLFAVRPEGSGDVTETGLAWKQKQGMAEIASPLCYRGRVFAIRGGGFASCFDAKTGKPLYLSKRIGAEGQYYASPIAAQGRVYVASTTGVVSVLEAGDELKVLARNDLGEAITATPAIAGNVIYVRTAEGLYAFSQ